MQLGADEVTGTSRSHTSFKWIEPWFLSYALLGASAAGIAPILIPLSIAANGSAVDAGIVVGVFNLGGLTAPLWGGIADHRGLHRLFFLAGLLVAAAGFVAFAFASTLIAKVALAFVQGAGAASVATVANLFIIEMHPKSEWDERIGWLQSFYGGGQVVGLLLAGILSNLNMRVGFLVAAGLSLAAILPGRFMKRKNRAASVARPLLKHPARHAGPNAGSPQLFYHHITVQSIRNLFQPFRPGFGGFILAWFLSFSGAAAFFSLYPVVMKQLYGVHPSISSVGFAAAATIGLFLYAPAGTWSKNHGTMSVLQVALWARILAFLFLVVLGFVVLPMSRLLALACFTVVVGAWSLLSVTGTELTARFSEKDEGEGLGLFNAATAVAGVLGAIVGGWCADAWGYGTVPLLGIVGTSMGLAVTVIVKRFEKNREGKIQ